MDWEGMLRDGTIAILFITIAVVGVTIFLFATGQPIPDQLWLLVTAAFSFWTGMGVGQWRAKAKRK